MSGASEKSRLPCMEENMRDEVERDCAMEYLTETGIDCPEHGPKDGLWPCCRKARYMTPEEHDAAYEQEEKLAKQRLRERNKAETPDSEFCSAMLEEAARMRVGPRKATCTGRHCRDRSPQCVGLPCWTCRRNIS